MSVRSSVELYRHADDCDRVHNRGWCERAAAAFAHAHAASVEEAQEDLRRASCIALFRLNRGWRTDRAGLLRILSTYHESEMELESCLQLVRLLRHVGGHSRCLRTAFACALRFRDDWRPKGELAMGLLAVGNSDDACRIAETAVGESGKHLEAVVALALAQLSRGCFEAARDLVSDASLPQDARIAALKAACCLQAGDTDAAIAWYRTSLELDPEDPKTARDYALAMAIIGNSEAGDAMLKAAEEFARRGATGDGAQALLARFLAKLDLCGRRSKSPSVNALRRKLTGLLLHPSAPFWLRGAEAERVARIMDVPDSITGTDDCLVVLRRADSGFYATATRMAEEGGGYFLRWHGHGMVVDPGYGFLRRFERSGFSEYDIDSVVLTHSHVGHSGDLRLLALSIRRRYERSLSLGTRPRPVRVYCNSEIFARNSEVFNAATPSMEYPSVLDPYSFPGQTHRPATGIVLTPTRVTNPHIDEQMADVGLRVDLSDDAVTPVLSLGLPGDTLWRKDLASHYQGCALLLLHVGQISVPDIMGDHVLQTAYDLSKRHPEDRASVHGFREAVLGIPPRAPRDGSRDTVEEMTARSPGRDHLGMEGVGELIAACRPQVAILAELPGDASPFRAEVARSLAELVPAGVACLAADLGMCIRLPDLSVRCYVDGDWIPVKQARVLVLPGEGGQCVYVGSDHGNMIPEEVAAALGVFPRLV